ncbi:MAG: reverse transcriptase domain-containing protein [Syntrophobacteraceae bacterium]
MCRYADDYVCLFQHKSDAEWFFQSLSPRMGKFGLELPPDKTKILRFSRLRKCEKTCFEFLGFEFRWGRSRNRKDIVVRRTSLKKLRRALADLTEWCKKYRHLPGKRFFRTFSAKLLGHFNYYGVIGNFVSIRRYYFEALRIVFKWHNRRSQRGSRSWLSFMELLKHFNVPKPRIVERLFESKAACQV